MTYSKANADSACQQKPSNTQHITHPANSHHNVLPPPGGKKLRIIQFPTVENRHVEDRGNLTIKGALVRIIYGSPSRS